MAFEFCCVVHFICYLRQLLCMPFSRVNVQWVCCEPYIHTYVFRSLRCPNVLMHKRAQKNLSTLSLSRSLNEPQTSLFIHHVNIRFTYISQRYLDWIYFLFLCFFSSSLLRQCLFCAFCAGVSVAVFLSFSSLFLFRLFCYLLCFTSYLFFYCATYSIFHDHFFSFHTRLVLLFFFLQVK